VRLLTRPRCCTLLLLQLGNSAAVWCRVRGVRCPGSGDRGAGAGAGWAGPGGWGAAGWGRGPEAPAGS